MSVRHEDVKIDQNGVRNYSSESLAEEKKADSHAVEIIVEHKKWPTKIQYVIRCYSYEPQHNMVKPADCISHHVRDAYLRRL